MIDLVKSVAMKALTSSILASNKQRGEDELKSELERIVPDLAAQYSFAPIDMADAFTVAKVRAQHCFQIKLTLTCIERTLAEADAKMLDVVDIGDSAGTHITYINELTKTFPDVQIRAISVNLDPIAVEKIRKKGLKAVLCRAEDLHKESLNGKPIHPDIFLSFEMLEHLFDPISFLHSIASRAQCRYLVVTVPYLKKSRVGLHHLRQGGTRDAQAENTHIFELCPEDWDLLFRFSGWEIVHSDRLTQYPSWGILNLTKYIWRRIDFDGFYGVILKPSLGEANRYKDW